MSNVKESFGTCGGLLELTERRNVVASSLAGTLVRCDDTFHLVSSTVGDGVGSLWLDGGVSSMWPSCILTKGTSTMPIMFVELYRL